MREGIHRFYDRLGRPIAFWSRWVLGVAVVPLLASFTQPLWNIRMLAPQYPQGLELDIYAHTIEGGHGGQDLHEINTLNHYIGMRKLDKADFSDLDWIPFAIGALALLALRAAAIGDVRSLVDLAVLTVYFCVFSAGRFAYMLYTYGHNLDPTAPIHMDPFTPAILGTKQVANFTTVSAPRGAAFLIGLFALTVVSLAAWHLWRAARRTPARPEAAVGCTA
jgi:hypothetical protein